MDLFVVQLTVGDWPASLAWYRDRLGLAVEWLDEPHLYALLAAGTSRVALRGGTPSPGTTKLTFHVPDLDAELCRLAAHGVTPITTVHESAEGYRAARLADPDGHRLELFEWIRPNRIPPAAV